MIENLEGGTISLEHSYAVGPLIEQIGHETLYEGVQDPFERPIWIHVYDFLGAQGEARITLTERQLRAAERSREVDSFGALLVVDHGELEEGVPFLISERCEGPSLEHLLEREGTLSPEETAQLIIRIAELIDPLHRHKRYHGSISPHWIFLPDEEMKRARLGHTHLSLSLAELRQIDSDLSFELIASLAPELLDEPEPGDTAQAPPSGSRQADIYALGVLAYRCLSGTHPTLDGERGGEPALQALREASPRPLGELGIDAGVSEVVMRALASDPTDRWSNAPAMAQALGRAAGLFDEPVSATIPPTKTVKKKNEAPAREPDEPTSWEGDEPDVISSDGRATVAGLAVLALLATNAFWLVWTISGPDQSADTRGSAFTTLQVTSDLPAMNVSDISASQQTPSQLGDTPLTFDLPRSDAPLKLMLSDQSAPDAKQIQMTFVQDAQPSLQVHVTRQADTPPTPTPPAPAP